MDLPQFLYHQRDQSRYISPSSSAPPLPHPFFPDDPNFHFPPNHHHHHLHNHPDQPLDFPLPPPPPPPPSSYRHLPIHPPPSPAPPLGYNPSQPQFVVSSSIHDDQFRSPPRRREFQRSPPLSSRIAFDGGFDRDFVDLNHSYHDSRFDVSDPSRVAVDNRPPLPRSPIDLDHGTRHREIDHRSGMPYPPPDMFRYSSGNSSRRGADYNDSFQTNPREEVLRARGEENYYLHDQLKEDSNVSCMESGASQSPLSRGNKFTSGSFDKHRSGSNYERESFRSRRSGNVVGKNQRWVHSKQTFRNMHNSYSDGSNDRGHGDRSDFRFISGKHGHSNAELGKYYNDNEVSIEGYNEYTSTPRKQVQKKSAFLRIQMANPCHSNRESEQVRDSDYFDEKNSFLRGKNQVGSLCYRMDSGKKREGSPMELDVSFKSNSLVAKAIVAPTQSAPISDMDTMPVNEKTTNVLVPHHDSTDSHLTGQNKDDLGTNDVTNLATCPQDFKIKLKDSEEKAIGPLAGDESNNLKDSSVKGNYSLRKTNVERPSQGKVSDVEGRNVSGKAATVRNMKKKKVVRKVAKKVVSPQLCLQTRKGDGNPHVKVGSLTNIPPVVTESDQGLEVSENKISTSGKNLDHGFVLRASQHDMSGSLDNRKADQSVLPVASKECQANTVMGMESVPADKTNKNRLDFPLNSLIKQGSGTSDHLETNGSSTAIPPLLNSNRDLKLRNGHNEFDFEITKGIEMSSVENVLGKESKGTMFFLAGSQSGLLSHLHDDLVNGKNLAVSIGSPMDFNNGVTQFQDNTPLSETCFVDGICKQLCANKVAGPPETDVVGVPAAKVTIRNSLVSVNPEASEMQIDSINLEKDSSGDHHTNQNSDDCRHCTNILVDEVLNCERIGITRVQESSGSSSVSLGLSLIERSTKAEDLILSEQGEKLLSKVSKPDFAGPVDINQETKSENLCVSFNSDGHCPSEQDVSGLESIVMGENSTTTGESAMHDYTSLGKSSKNKLLMGFDVDDRGNETLLKSREKQKICIASPVLPCPSAEANDGAAFTFISSLSDQLNSNGESMEGKEAAASTRDALFTANPVSTDCLNGISMMLDDIPTKEIAIEVNIDRDPLECLLKYEQPEKNSCSIQEESTVCQSLSLSASLGNEQEESDAPIKATNQRDDMDVVTGRRKELNGHAAEGQSISCNNKTEQRDSPEVPSSQTLNCSNPESVKASSNVGQDNLHHIERFADGKGFPTAKSDSEIMGSVFDKRGDLGSSEAYNVPEMHKLNREASFSHTDLNMDCADDKKVKKKSNDENELKASTDTPFPQPLAVHQKLGCTNAVNNLSTGKVLPRVLEELKNGLQADNNFANSCKNEQKMGYYKSQAFPGKSFSTYTASKKLTSATYSKKPRSWHRNVNSPSPAPAPGNKVCLSFIPPQAKLLGGDGMLQSTSYIRKGNSLVRKPSPVAARVLGSHDLSSSSLDQHDCWPSIKSNSKVEVTNPPFHSKARGTDANVDKPYPPQLSSGPGSPNYSIPMGDCDPSPCHETESSLMKSKHVSDLSRLVGDSLILLAPKTQVGTADEKENLTETRNKNSVSLVVKKMVYVKRKSNQLVATSNPCDLSTKNMETTCSLASDGYYKRKKNQLIRASPECQMKQTSLPTEDISNPGAKSSYGDGDARSFNKRQQFKAVVKTHGPLKSSLVWTLRSSVAAGNGACNLQNHKMAPRLFPWKRTYWKTFKLNASTQRNSSSSIVRKLLLLRNRNTVYKRSKHGFSLRKSKVLSVGRSSLKWSKSIEKHSKKANEEATRAVADAERKKRERNWDASASTDTLGGSQFSYDQASGSTALQPKKSAKKFYIPRRLMIGNDEYVKIGNGNQLVRNPKRRARILASEKIRWSLHTARHRLAKKRKYCQFFTRFGKCNKEGGKCPYIHDTSKIAVCTKFLNGLCSNASCKLTHKVIPERMPDCSYFLQGLCSSKNCAYRHVNVNSKAPTCEAFLRGYCALGNECRKKHSYVCPLFEATGTCPDRSTCKLHHPERQTKGRKRKRSEGKNNDQGRYFGSMNQDVSGSRMVVTEKQHPVKSNDPFLEGDLTDYISLDLSSDEDIVESHDSTSQTTSFYQGYLSELLLDDPDELIKPVRVMNENLSVQ
ncbi:uncharacterized protein LOC120085770 [Benincasa hispida]|uniref:uncharacterized protein LOC120085770 n=1 Tax=Benincasa hispida TaxID=102211 RepID=UPI0018FF33B8|nr:uncharacterized protein LOC120085770 [Benincasa hispida]